MKKLKTDATNYLVFIPMNIYPLIDTQKTYVPNFQKPSIFYKDPKILLVIKLYFLYTMHFFILTYFTALTSLAVPTQPTLIKSLYFKKKLLGSSLTHTTKNIQNRYLFYSTFCLLASSLLKSN